MKNEKGLRFIEPRMLLQTGYLVLTLISTYDQVMPRGALAQSPAPVGEAGTNALHNIYLPEISKQTGPEYTWESFPDDIQWFAEQYGVQLDRAAINFDLFDEHTKNIARKLYLIGQRLLADTYKESNYTPEQWQQILLSPIESLAMSANPNIMPNSAGTNIEINDAKTKYIVDSGYGSGLADRFSLMSDEQSHHLFAAEGTLQTYPQFGSGLIEGLSQLWAGYVLRNIRGLDENLTIDDFPDVQLQAFRRQLKTKYWWGIEPTKDYRNIVGSLDQLLGIAREGGISELKEHVGASVAEEIFYQTGSDLGVKMTAFLMENAENEATDGLITQTIIEMKNSGHLPNDSNKLQPGYNQIAGFNLYARPEDTRGLKNEPGYHIKLLTYYLNGNQLEIRKPGTVISARCKNYSDIVIDSSKIYRVAQEGVSHDSLYLPLSAITAKNHDGKFPEKAVIEFEVELEGGQVKMHTMVWDFEGQAPALVSGGREPELDDLFNTEVSVYGQEEPEIKQVELIAPDEESAPLIFEYSTSN